MTTWKRTMTFGAIGALVVLGTNVTSVLANSNALSGSTATSTSTSMNSGNAASPQVKLSKNDVLKIVAGLFPDLMKQMGTPAIDLQAAFSGQTDPMYMIDWQEPGGFNNQTGPRLSNNNVFVTVDANTGQVMSYNNSKSQWTEIHTSISVDDAKGIAIALLNQLAPNQVSQLALQSGSGATSNGFTFQFVREVNGIPAPFDAATIQVDPTGHVTSYTFTWHNVTFPAKPASLLGLQQATTTYQQDLQLRLQYEPFYDRNGNGPTITRLVYTPVSDGGFTGNGSTPILDAQSGQLLGLDGKELSSGNAGNTMTPLVPGGSTTFPIKQSAPMSQADLESQVEKQLGISGETWTLSNAQEQSNTGGPVSNDPTLNINFVNQTTGANIDVQVDMLDGVMENYNASPGNPPATSTSTASSAASPSAIADQFAKQLFPNLTGAIARLSTQSSFGAPSGQKMYQYDFLVNGIPVQGFIVQVDVQSGSVLGYFLNQDPAASFPSAKNVISPSTAVEDFLKESPVQLEYMLPQSETSGVNTQIQYASSAELVYAATPPVEVGDMLDATSGQWVNPFSGSSTKVKSGRGQSEAQQAIAELEQNGVVTSSEASANLSAPITHAQFIAWLERAYNFNISGSPSPQFSDVSSNNPYASEISTALMQGWLPNTGKLYPNDSLTRSEAAVWLVDWMNWSGPAKHSDFFNIPFSDTASVPKEDQGAATMMSDTGVLPLENGKFNPNETMTIGDAAVALVNAIHVWLKDGQQ